MIMYRRHDWGILQPVFAFYEIDNPLTSNVLCLLTVAKIGLLYRLGIPDETRAKR
jgi:hypothetical protein